MLAIALPIVPTPEGAFVLWEWIEHVRSPGWPDECCIHAWLFKNGYDETATPEVHATLFGGAARACQLWQMVVAVRLMTTRAHADAEECRELLVMSLEAIARRCPIGLS